MKANKFIIFFLLKAIAVYIAWYLIYDLWLEKVGAFDNWIVDYLVYFSVSILELFNYILIVDYHTMGIDGAASHVLVGTGCNGVELYALFAGFVLIFEGSWKHKLWFIPVGVFVLFFFNVFRIIALAITGLYSAELLDFNHKYTFTIIMYILTFIGWMLWVKYFSVKDKKMISDE
jgi:exosortase/archaeosortase family protein